MVPQDSAVAKSTSRAGWATPRQWDAHRHLITALYRDEKKTLLETKRIMEERHNFFGTNRMYKSRFQQWKIEKKIKREEAIEYYRYFAERDKIGKRGVVFMNGREIPVDRYQRYRYRAPATVAEQILQAERDSRAGASTGRPPSSHIICRTPSPPPSMSPQLEDPADLAVPRDCMRIIDDYLASAFDAGTWDFCEIAHRPERDCFTWTHYLATSQGLMAHNRRKEGFEVLGTCFDLYQAHLQSPSPLFWLDTYRAALLLANMDRRLGLISMERRFGDEFVSFASNLSSVVLPVGHPFNLVWSRLRMTGLTGLQQHAAAVCEAYLRKWQPQFLSFAQSEEALVQLAFELIRLRCSGMISYGFFRDSVEPLRRQLSNLVHWEYLLHEARCRMAYLLVNHGRLPESRLIIEDIITWLDSLPQAAYTDLRCKCIWAMFEIKQKQRAVEEAQEAGFALIKYCEDCYGPIHLQTFDALSAVEDFHDRIGNRTTAQELSEEFEKRWADFRRMGMQNNGFPHPIHVPWLHCSAEIDEEQWRIQEAIDLFDFGPKTVSTCCEAQCFYRH